VDYIGEGLYHRAYNGSCWVELDGRVQEVSVVVRWPRRDAGDEQRENAEREHALLSRLETLDLPISVPRSLALIPVDEGLASVQTAVAGIDVPSRKLHVFRDRAVPDLVAEAADAVHRLEPASFTGLIHAYSSRLDHAERRMAAIGSPGRPEGDDAAAWLHEHLPPPTPPRFLHGDLLPQNLRIDLEPRTPTGVIDWTEAVIGDPAYDLAVVTRGRRKVFGVADGRRRLLDAYNRIAIEPLTRADIGVYELVMMLGWAVERERSDPGSPGAKQSWRELAGLLRRLG